MAMMYDAFLDQMKKDLEADLSGICGKQWNMRRKQKHRREPFPFI